MEHFMSFHLSANCRTVIIIILYLTSIKIQIKDLHDTTSSRVNNRRNDIDYIMRKLCCEIFDWW